MVASFVNFDGRFRFATLFVSVALLIGATAGCSDDPDGGGEDAGLIGPDVQMDAGSDTEDDDKWTLPDTTDDPLPDADAGEASDTPGWNLNDVEGDGGLQPLDLTNMAPSRGPVDGGTQFVIEGAGFTSKTTVYFGSREASTRVIDGRIVGRTPEAAGPGSVSVKALDPQTGEAVMTDAFTYTESLHVGTIVPSRVPTKGGTEITIEGTGFGSATRVSFDGTTALRHETVDSETIRVMTPPKEPGSVNVRVTGKDESVVVEDGVTYFQPIEIGSITPAAGPTSGGTRVTLEGQGFQQGMSVSFGNAQATVQSVGSEGQRASVTIPPNASGLVHVGVQTPDGDAALKQNAFYYRSSSSEFHLAAVDPTYGPASGNKEVRVIGAGLGASGVSIEFGGSAGTIVRSGTGYAVVDLPVHSPGRVDVVARDGSGTSSRLDSGFEYIETLTVTNVSPAEGNVSGGTSVVIEGSGFDGLQKVQFGGIAAEFTVESNTKITATTPRHGPGTVDVTLERGQMTVTEKDAFTFVEGLEIYGLSPVRGSSAGGTYVELRGRGFTGDMGVTFGGNAAKDVQLLDTQTLAVRTPSHQPAAVDVNVRREQDSANAPVRFVYFNPTSSSGGAWGGPIEGSVNVSVYSVRGTPLSGAFVMLSTNPETTYKGAANRNGVVTLSGPDIYGAQTVTATAPGYSTTTVQHVDAENVTIILSPIGGSGPGGGGGAPTATFKGKLTGLNKADQPKSAEYLMGIVLATKDHPWVPNIDQKGSNVVEGGNGTYKLTTRVGDLALVAFGGLYDTESQTFTPVLMGVKRYQTAAGNTTYTRDIELDIELDDQLTLKLSNPPSAPGGPNVNQVQPFYDFGFEGVVRGMVSAQGQSDVLTVDQVASLSGKLSDVEYMAIGGAYTTTEQGGLGLPQAVSVARGIGSTNGVASMPRTVKIPFVDTPAPGAKPYNDVISLAPSTGAQPDLYYFRVLGGLGTEMWSAFIPGTTTSVQLPEFPDFSHLPKRNRPQPYPGGKFMLSVYAIDHPTLEYDSFSYADLATNQWTAFSVYNQRIEF